MTPLCGYCPFFSNKKLSFMSRQIQRVAHMAASQVHTVEAVGEFLGEADSHTTGKGKGRACQKAPGGPPAAPNIGSHGHISGSLPLECGGNYLPNKWLAIGGITIAVIA
jgi:hypothetical protein